MQRGYASFCTEEMAKRMLFIPSYFAEGHLVDARDITEAVARMRKAVERIKRKPEQMRLF